LFSGYCGSNKIAKESIMTTVIKKGSSAEIVLKKYAEITKARKRKELRDLCGALSLKQDPLKLQNEWRDDWK